MATIITIAILIAFIAFICMALVFVNNKDRKKMADELINLFNKLKKEEKLSISHQETMKNSVLGLDEVQRKFFAVSAVKNSYDFHVIHLDELRSCSKKKLYLSINIGSQKREKYETRVEKIILEFEFLDNRPQVQIPFYESGENHLMDMFELEQKAKNWEIILANKINYKIKSIA